MSVLTVEKIKVTSSGRPNVIAGSIAKNLEVLDQLEASCVGAAAVNNCMKAIAIARSYMISSGIDLYCVPCFENIEIDGIEKSSMKMIIKKKIV